MSSPKEFTLEEANALLPKLEPLVGRLLEKRAKVVSMRQQIADLLDNQRGDFGGEIASEMAREFGVIDGLVKEIQSHGCVIKSLNAGLLDFLAKRDGRHVYLCWRYGEPRIEHYHELHTGFNGRRRI